MRVREALDLGQRSLPTRAGLADPRREALWLLAAAWPRDESWLRLNPNAVVPQDVVAVFRRWLARRAAGEPAHHLVGHCPFWGRDFAVSSAVLIPRPETELVILAVLGLPLPAAARVVDIGTGSGAIAITLACERPGWAVVAADISLAALEVAAVNAADNGGAVCLAASDCGSALGGTFDLVVANLPYIETDALDGLPIEVAHDPRVALDGGCDGLDQVRRLIADTPRLLAPGGFAVLELGEEQAAAVADLAARSGLEEVQRVRDLGGCERIIVLQKKSKCAMVPGTPPTCVRTSVTAFDTESPSSENAFPFMRGFRRRP